MADEKEPSIRVSDLEIKTMAIVAEALAKLEEKCGASAARRVAQWAIARTIDQSLDRLQLDMISPATVEAHLERTKRSLDQEDP